MTRWFLLALLLRTGCSEPAAAPPAAVSEEVPATVPTFAGAFELPPLSEEERNAPSEDGARRVGVHRDLPEDLAARGIWVEGEGGPVWRLTLRSPGAVALRLHFLGLAEADGVVRVEEADEALRPAASRDPVAGGPEGETWSDVYEGEAVVVEYRPREGASRSPPFRLDKLSHLWVSPF